MDQFKEMKKLLHRLKVEKFYRERKYHKEISKLNLKMEIRLNRNRSDYSRQSH